MLTQGGTSVIREPEGETGAVKSTLEPGHTLPVFLLYPNFTVTMHLVFCISLTRNVSGISSCESYSFKKELKVVFQNHLQDFP